MADASPEDEARVWLESVLQESFGEGVTLAAALCSGVRLCKLANIVRPGSIPKFSLDPKMAIKARENITLFIGALKSFGMKDFEVFSTLDLAEGEKQNMRSVVIALHALGRLCQSGEFAALGLPKLGAKVLEKNTRVFSEKQLQEATAAVSVLNLGSSSMAKSAAASLLTGQAIAVHAVAAGGGGGGGGGAAAAAAAAAAAPRSTTPPPEAPAAPAGWILKTSKTTGKSYYQNKATGATCWEVPPAAE